MPTLMQDRAVARIVTGKRTVEGDGFQIRRPFPTSALMDFDPFLLLDHFGPMEFGPGEAKGVPPHPHRGFETITYLLEGSSAHHDSRGGSGILGPGDVQWMTAGSGIVHSEMPPAEFLRDGGRIQGIQLWINLPQKDKLTPPRYADVPAAEIPAAQTPDGRIAVKVISGSALGVSKALGNHSPFTYLHFTLAPGARWQQPIPESHNALAYVLSGEGRFGSEEKAASEGQAVLFASAGETVTLAAQTELSVLLLAGKPLGEPVTRYGPFVMNTENEIRQAVLDYQSGRMGRLDE